MATLDAAIWPLVLFVGFLALYVPYVVTRRFRSDPPESLATFGDLARRITGLASAARECGLMSPDEVRSAVREVLVAVLGVRPEAVVPEARLVEDLGLG